MMPGESDRCATHDFVLQACGERRPDGKLADFYECQRCDTALYVESYIIARKTALTRNLDMGDLTRTVWEASNLDMGGLTGTVGGYSH